MLTGRGPGRIADRAVLRPDCGVHVVDVELMQIFPARVDRVQERDVLADSVSNSPIPKV